ncbi:Uncharacterised protein [Klebsiella michiganensis]|uniref:Uncharacterized protein n=1 Tax=Klebsiella michiganensis TaxID=1134687 RepID=A0A7H4N3E4_9ENTR|nr:Uncharacterised protein [Klebsiella michiganensis]
MDEPVGRRWRQLLAGDKFAQIDGVVLGQQQNHILAGAQYQGAHGGFIRNRLSAQRFRRLRVGAEIVLDKIGNPLGAGEIEIVLGTKIVGNGGDILTGLGGNIAGCGVQAVFAKLGDCGGDKLAFRLLAPYWS